MTSTPSATATPPAATTDAARWDAAAREVAPIPRMLSHRIAYTLLKPMVAMFSMLLFAVRGHHVDRAVRVPNYILLSNHQSYPDPIFVGMVSPRPMRFMARDNLFRLGLKQLIIPLGAYPVTRGRRDEGAFQYTQGIIAAGQSVLIFGEGTRTPDGEIQRLRGGVEILCRRTHATIVPVALDGAFQMAPRTRSMSYLRAEAIHVVVGEPIYAEEYLAWPERHIPEYLRPRLQALLEEARTRRLRAGGGGVLTLTRPVIELFTAYYRVLGKLIKAPTKLMPRRRRRG